MIELSVSVLFALTAIASVAVVIRSLIEGHDAWRSTRAALHQPAHFVTARITIMELQVYQETMRTRPHIMRRVVPAATRMPRRRLPLPAAA